MKLAQLYSEGWDWGKFTKGTAAGMALGLSALIASPGVGVTEPRPIVAPERPTRARAQRAGFDIGEFRKMLIRREGSSNVKYGQEPGEVAIGVGHTMYNPNLSSPTLRSRRAFASVFGDVVDFDAVLSGQQSLTDNQVAALVDYDITEHIKRARRLMPKFNNYPAYLQYALLDSVYRGDTGSKALRLINGGRWREAATEYLNRRDYRNADALGIPGIRGRMENNRAAMLKYAQELGQ